MLHIITMIFAMNLALISILTLGLFAQIMEDTGDHVVREMSHKVSSES